MELSLHGLEHIWGRTRMWPEDVQELIVAGAYVYLGEALGKKEMLDFLLFWSSSGHRPKIALVTADRRELVSIWERTYELPEGIAAPTAEKCMWAETLLSQFVWDRVRRAREAQQEGLVPVRVNVSVTLRRNRPKSLFTETLGKVPTERTAAVDTIVSSFPEHLLHMARTMEREQKNWTRDRIRYTFVAARSETDIQTFVPVRHLTLKKLVRAA